MENNNFKKTVDKNEILSLKEKYLALIKKDRALINKLNEIGISSDSQIKEHIGTILDVKEDFDYCNHCPGYGLCNKDHAHYVYTLSYDGTFLFRALKPCPFKEDDLEKDKVYLIREFPKSWRNSTILSLDKSNARTEVIERYIDAKFGAKRNWIFISGGHRCGKSFVAATLLNDYLSDGEHTGAFINYREWVNDLHNLSYTDKQSFKEKMGVISSCDLLVLDEFGNEYKNEFIRDSITLTLLNERARKGLMTIFVSEFDFDEIANMMAINIAGKARVRKVKNLFETLADHPIDISTVAIY